MSAFGTKKPLSDVEQQLSFPTVFEQAYAVNAQPLAFEGGDIRPGRGLPYDKNLQGAYHEQKRREAHATVRNAVRDTRMATNRALVSHAGYFGMPQAVLSQRVFANPSMGSGQADIYPARRTAPGAGAPFSCVSGGGLTGGVLRSKAGQEFGKKILMNRIAQLNAIDAASQGLDTGAPISTVSDPDFATSQGLAEVPGTGAMVKLNSLVAILINTLAGGWSKIGRFGLLDFTEMMSLLFRLAPSLNREELEELLESFDEATEYAKDIDDNLDEAVPEEQFQAEEGEEDEEEEDVGSEAATKAASDAVAFNFAKTLTEKVPQVREYVAKMLGAVNKSPKDRLALSKALVKSLGLIRFSSANIVNRAEQEAREERRGGPGGGGGGPAGGDEDDDMGDEFMEAPAAREDEEHDEPPQPFRRAPEAGPALGLRARDPRRGLDEPGPQRFAAQGALGYFGEAGMAPQPALLNPFRQGSMAFAEAPTMAAYRQAMLPVMPGYNPGREAAMDRAEVPLAPEMPEASAAAQAAPKPTLADIAKKYQRGVPSVEPGSIEALVRKPTKGIRARGKVSAAIAKDAAKAIKAVVSTKGTKKSAVVAPAPAPAPAKPKGKGKAKAKAKDDGFVEEAVRMMKGAAAPAHAKKGRPAKGPILLNGSGNRHKGPCHQMPDGTYMTGKTHSARSKPLTIA